MLGAPLREMRYNAQQVAFLVRSRGSITGMRDYFLKRTRDSSGVDTYMWEGPWPSRTSSASPCRGSEAP